MGIAHPPQSAIALNNAVDHAASLLSIQSDD